MGSQLSLLADPNEVAFQRWIRRNRHVVDTFIRLAREWHAAGHDRCGIGMLTERVRWEHGMRGARDDAGFKINNNYRSRLARVILTECPDLPPDFFETRRLATERDN